MYVSYRGFSLKEDYLKRYANIIIDDLKLRNVGMLVIQIEVKNIGNSEYFGYCSNWQGDYKTFKLVLNSECSRHSLGERVCNLAHELRHVYQKVNDLKDSREAVKVKLPDNYSNEQWEAYYNHPCEIDARKYETTVTKKFKLSKHLNFKKVS